MAINVDTVYKTVLLILNKEQRGYMTPPEFNRIGTQVQLDIFEQYFEDLNQQLRVPQADVDYADRQMAIDEKISIFKTTGNATLNTTIANYPYWDLPTTDIYGTNIAYNQLAPLTANQAYFYKLGTVTYQPAIGLPTELQRLQRNEFYNIQKSNLTASTLGFPTYLYENNKLFIRPTTVASNTSSISVDFLRKPKDIQWAFTPGIGQSYLFDNTAAGNSVNFELSSTEQTSVILKVLLYAGIVIRDPQIIQAAAQQIQQEEINQKS